MIECKYDKWNLVMEVKGHADYAEKGKDIICSAASMLVHMLRVWLDKMDAANKLSVVNLRVAPGYAWFDCTTKDGYVEELQTVMDMVSEGFFMLAAQYPEHVQCYAGEGKPPQS